MSKNETIHQKFLNIPTPRERLRFELKVFTPVGLALEASVTAVSLWTSDGQIGILPNHAKYMGLLGTGTLEFVNDTPSKEKTRVQVAGGFCSFANNTLSILADSVEV